MKKLVVFLAICMLLFLLVACGETGNKENDEITGTWQAFGTKVDDEIVPYKDTFDKDTVVSLEKQMLTFRSNDNVVVKNGEVEVEGDYKKDSNSYLVSFTFNEPDNVQQLVCHIEGDYLIVEQVLPDEYNGYDPGDSVAYKRLD
jgi:hypothetical protein